MTFLQLRKPIAETHKSPTRKRRAQSRVRWNQQGTCIWIDSEGRHQSQPIEILDRSHDGLGLRLSERLEAGQTVWVETDGGTFPKGVVCFCEPDGEGYRAGLMRVERERRRFDREPSGGAATLTWMVPPAARVSLSVLVRNITADGLQLEAQMAVPISSVIRLSGQELECQAITRYCRSTDGMYVIGIEFLRSPYDKDTPDSRKN